VLVASDVLNTFEGCRALLGRAVEVHAPDAVRWPFGPPTRLPAVPLSRGRIADQIQEDLIGHGISSQLLDQPVVAQWLAQATCQRAGLGDQPRRVLAELSRIKLVDVVLPTRDGTEICRRCVTRPDDHQAIRLQRLGLELPSNLPLTDKKPIEM